jgi:hypothetical protein
VGRDRKLEALLLAVVLATVAVLGVYRGTGRDWAPATPQMTEAPRHNPAPADRQAQAELAVVVFAAALLPSPPQPTSCQFFALETDGCRPGYRSRIDHPPRAGA